MILEDNQFVFVRADKSYFAGESDFTILKHLVCITAPWHRG